MASKQCSKCLKEKSFDSFKKNAMGRNGLHSVCKECCSARTVTTPKICKICGVEKSASNFRERGKNPYCKPCQNERVATNRTPKSRQHNARRVQELSTFKYQTNEEHRQKVLARGAVNTALKKGILKKPSSCPICKRNVRIHGHHHNGYALKYRLDVVWLCAKCHHQAEAK